MQLPGNWLSPLTASNIGLRPHLRAIATNVSAVQLARGVYSGSTVAMPRALFTVPTGPSRTRRRVEESTVMGRRFRSSGFRLPGGASHLSRKQLHNRASERLTSANFLPRHAKLRVVVACSELTCSSASTIGVSSAHTTRLHLAHQSERARDQA